MKTYYLGREEVHAYLSDFITRLRQFDPRPNLWCPITESGDDLLNALLASVTREAPELMENVDVLPISIAADGAVGFVIDEAEELLPNASVLLLDGAIHSGRMMSRCAKEILRMGATHLSSYTLVLKRGSRFIPTLWGVMIGEADRAYFLLDSIPNNRMDAGDRPQPLVHLELLKAEDCSLPMIASGIPSIDRVTWEDRVYQMQSSDSRVFSYLLRRGPDAVGFITLHFQEDESLHIDEVVVSGEEHGKGYGGILVRFADSLGRSSETPRIRLNAIAERVSMYRNFGFVPIPGRPTLRIGNEEYQPMERALLSHQSPGA